MMVSTKQPLKIAIIIGIITVLGTSMSIVVSDSDADRTVGYAPLVSDMAVFAQYDKPYDVVVLGNDKTAAYLVGLGDQRVGDLSITDITSITASS